MAKLARLLQLYVLILPTLMYAGPRSVRRPSIASPSESKTPRLQRVSPISPLRFEPNVGQAGPRFAT